MEDDQDQILDLDEAFSHRSAGNVSQGAQVSGTPIAMASSAESLPPLVERRGLQCCDHQQVSKKEGETTTETD